MSAASCTGLPRLWCNSLRSLHPTILVLLLLGCVAPGCAQKDPLYEQTIYAFGTLISLTFWDVERQQAEDAARVLEREFQRMHQSWHAWEPGSLQRVNQRLSSGERFTAPPSLLPLMVAGQDLYRKSDGLFNPAVGKLVALWGFHQDDPENARPPDAAAVEALVSLHPTMDDITIEGTQVRSSNPAVQLDLGAFAKGYGIDVAIARLRELGIPNAIVNAGGDLRAIGKRGDRAWRIGIRDPRKPGVLATVEVAGDESVFTSGDYERNYTDGKRRYHHIIDPRTGYPATGTASATVIHTDATTADAAATAVFIAGPEHWPEIARSMGIHYVLLVDDKGAVYMNPAMASRVRFQDRPPPPVAIGPKLHDAAL